MKIEVVSAVSARFWVTECDYRAILTFQPYIKFRKLVAVMSENYQCNKGVPVFYQITLGQERFQFVCSEKKIADRDIKGISKNL